MDDNSTFSDIADSDVKPFDSADYESNRNHSKDKKSVKVQAFVPPPPHPNICLLNVEKKRKKNAAFSEAEPLEYKVHL